MSVLWIYAIVDAAAEPGAATGVAGEPLQLHRRDDVAAAFGRLDAPATLSIQALRAHHAAVRLMAASVPAILPVRFGETAVTAAELDASLRERAPALGESLDRVRGRVQMTLRVFGPSLPDADERESLPTFDGSAGPGLRYLERRRREAARRRCLPEIEALRARLRSLVCEERIVRTDRHPLLGTVYDLVAPESVAEYQAIVARFTAEGALHRVAVSGPGAPWAFTGPREVEDGGRRSA